MKLNNKVRFLRVVLPTPYPIGNVYCYLIPRDPVTVIDVGVNSPETERLWKERLSELGFSFKDIKRIVLTHGHSDHYGFAGRFAELSGAEIYIHPMDVDKVSSRKKYYLRAVSWLKAFGVPESYIERFVAVLDKEAPYCVDLDPGTLRPLNDGDLLEFDGLSLRVIHVPGHSPGHVILFDEKNRDAITGDFIFTDLTPDPIMDVTKSGERTKSMILYCESLKKIESLGLKRFYPAHREFEGDFSVAVFNLKARFEKKAEKILSILKDGEITPFQLAKLLYPDMSEFEVFIVMSEIIGRLDLLEKKGLVCLKKRGDLFYCSVC